MKKDIGMRTSTPHCGTRSRLLRTTMCSQGCTETMRFVGSFGSHPRSIRHLRRAPIGFEKEYQTLITDVLQEGAKDRGREIAWRAEMGMLRELLCSWCPRGSDYGDAEVSMKRDFSSYREHWIPVL